jgi:hypothetical protein
MINGHQTDIYFVLNKVLYLFESKTNPDLDTKKIDKEVEVVSSNKVYCENYYKENGVDRTVVSKFLILTKIDNYKKPLTRDMFSYYDEFFSIFGINITTEEWNDKMAKYGLDIEFSWNMIINSKKLNRRYELSKDAYGFDLNFEEWLEKERAIKLKLSKEF